MPIYGQNIIVISHPVHNKYPVVYVGCRDLSEIFQSDAQPQFILLQNPFRWQFVE